MEVQGSPKPTLLSRCPQSLEEVPSICTTVTDGRLQNLPSVYWLSVTALSERQSQLNLNHAGGGRASDLTKINVRQVACNAVVLRVIECVQHVALQFERRALGKSEVLSHRYVKVPYPGGSHRRGIHIATPDRLPRGPGDFHELERSGIQILQVPKAAAILVYCSVWIDYVRPPARLTDAGWCSRSGSPDAGNVPASQDLPCYGRVGKRCGRLVDPVHGDIMCNIAR